MKDQALKEVTYTPCILFFDYIFTGASGAYSQSCSGVFYWEQDQGAVLLFGGEDEGHQWGNGRNGQGNGLQEM